MSGASTEPMRLARSLTIANEKGLHARASAKFAALAETFASTVTVSKDDYAVVGTSIMGLLLLAAAKGSQIDLVVEGDDAEAAMAAIAALVEGGFGELD